MSVDEKITVVIPTSSIPEHPKTRIIERAIRSLRSQLRSPILITCDAGTHPDVIRSCAYIGDGIRAFSFGEEYKHQSGMLVRTLPLIETPLLLYWEHDWELLPDVPWAELSELIMSGEFNYIKLHAAPRIHPFHVHLMEQMVIYQSGVPSDRYQDNRPGIAVPILHSRQWSQNPHLASTEFYRSKILPFCDGKAEFIENLIHGAVAHSPWQEFKCGIYCPPNGDFMRVWHLDGRGTPA